MEALTFGTPAKLLRAAQTLAIPIAVVAATRPAVVLPACAIQPITALRSKTAPLHLPIVATSSLPARLTKPLLIKEYKATSAEVAFLMQPDSLEDCHRYYGLTDKITYFSSLRLVP